MYAPNQIKRLKPSVRTDQSPSRRRLIPAAALALAIAWIVVSPAARAVTPAPDGGYPNQNTAEGEDALKNVTSGGSNTAVGFNALFNLTIGVSNTAVGALTLVANTTGSDNTAIGYGAMYLNETSGGNTAIGSLALGQNSEGEDNTAAGVEALSNNINGDSNTAHGAFALYLNLSGSENTAVGSDSLDDNTSGSDNTSIGSLSLHGNQSGNNNIALGYAAGFNLTTGSDNIDIGAKGTAGESGKIRIGTAGTHTATFIAGIRGTPIASGVAVGITADGQLGVRASSARFKEAVKPMDKASQGIYSLQPVTFRYKHDLDPDGIPQFGLVAEQVAKVNPDLVARDDQGKPYTVRYEAVNAMLLNEFLKEHSKVEEQQTAINELKSKMAQQDDLRSTVAQQQIEIAAMTSQIQRVSQRLAVDRPAPRIVLNKE